VNEPADLIVCRHVLEHFSNPRQLITTVREAVGYRHDLFVYFEAPSGHFILRNKNCWEFIYQHYSYFTQKSLATLFSECGFEVRDVRERFGGQFLTIEACAPPEDFTAKRNSRREREAAASPDTIATLCAAIGRAFCACVAKWSNYFEQQSIDRRRIVLWGAGAKAVTFLNIVDPAGSSISHVVDINPRKVGRFIAGSGQQIVDPSAVSELRPDVVVLTNAIYREEIASTLDAFGLDPDLLVA
jgi:hypothetical protein